MLHLSEEEIFELLNNPPFAKELTHYTHQFAAANPVCGDKIRGQLLVEGGILAEIFLEAKGCVISRVSAAVWLQELHGKQWASVMLRNPDDIFLSIGDVIPMRRQCALLCPTEIKKMPNKPS